MGVEVAPHASSQLKGVALCQESRHLGYNLASSQLDVRFVSVTSP